VFFYNVAHLLGIDRLAAMGQRFGFGARLGIDIPGERPGLVPTTAWKFATTGVRWQPGETISAGIGQSYFNATPLQLAIQAARLVTGRAVVPRLARAQGVMRPGEITDTVQPDFPPLDLVPQDLRLVLDGMNAVVNEPGGTAYTARITEPGLWMGGKSGTSQVRQISQAERQRGLPKMDRVPWKERDHALFIAFAPVEAPRYVCAVVVEHGGRTGGGGSAVAAPICRDLLIATQKRDPARHWPNSTVVAEAVTR
jgi:penicillin-binding protein 2